MQSAVAFTSMARGNIAAAICSASFSTLAGVLLTPLLTALLLRGGTVPFSARQAAGILIQLVVPFLAGQAARPLLADLVARHRKVTTLCDRGSILLVVYAAFGAGVTAGIWQQVSAGRLLALLAVCAVLLTGVLMFTAGCARLLGFPREDRVTAVFCGSTKSLAGGLPMATVLFASGDVSLIVLPLMLYHLLQLLVCAVIARRWTAAAGAGPPSSTPRQVVGDVRER